MSYETELRELVARLDARVGAETAEQVTRLHMLYQAYAVVDTLGTDQEVEVVSHICQSFTAWYIQRHIEQDQRETFCHELDRFIHDVEVLQDTVRDEVRLADGEAIALAESLISKVRH